MISLFLEKKIDDILRTSLGEIKSFSLIDSNLLMTSSEQAWEK